MLGDTRAPANQFELLQQLKLIIEIKINSANRSDVKVFLDLTSIKAEIYWLHFGF